MNDIELDKLIAATAPFGDEEVGRWDLAGPRPTCAGRSWPPRQRTNPSSSRPATPEALRTRPPTMGRAPEISLTRRSPRQQPRRWLLPVLAAAAAVALVAVGVWASGDRRDATPAAETATPPPPRLLVDLPGWRVTGADEYTPDLAR